MTLNGRNLGVLLSTRVETRGKGRWGMVPKMPKTCIFGKFWGAKKKNVVHAAPVTKISPASRSPKYSYISYVSTLNSPTSDRLPPLPVDCEPLTKACSGPLSFSKTLKRPSRLGDGQKNYLVAAATLIDCRWGPNVAYPKGNASRQVT